jgi:hypothetical protein
MSRLARGCLAGWGASRMGGGCVGTVILFIILYILLGYLF